MIHASAARIARYTGDITDAFTLRVSLKVLLLCSLEVLLLSYEACLFLQNL